MYFVFQVTPSYEGVAKELQTGIPSQGNVFDTRVDLHLLYSLVTDLNLIRAIFILIFI
jgi:hypothetical protein